MPSGRRSGRRPYGAPAVPVDVERALGGVRRERSADGEWTVRTVRGSAKGYTCPGCRQEVPPGVEHVVAWESDGLLGAEAALADRRHWHSGCWAARSRRR